MATYGMLGAAETFQEITVAGTLWYPLPQYNEGSILILFDPTGVFLTCLFAVIVMLV